MAQLRLVSVSFIQSQPVLLLIQTLKRHFLGQTQALASLSGPLEVRPNHELPSQATLEIHIRPLASVPGTDSRALATTLKAILTPALYLSHHPRTLIQIVGQALCGSDSGSGLGSTGHGWNASLIASLVNACSAALINAGSVPMKGVVCAVAVGRVPDPNSPGNVSMVLDPSEAELASLIGGGCFVFMFSSVLPSFAAESDVSQHSLLWTNYSATSGSIQDSEFGYAQNLALEGAEETWRALKNSLKPDHGMWKELPVTEDASASKPAKEPSPEIDDAEMEI
jgi:exosome complex component RRP46